jgi:hypothetical protein
MAKGYQLIKAEILTSTAASVTFSNIPQNFTDLQVLCSVRSNRSDSSAVVDQYYIRLNGNNNSNSKVLRGNSSTGSSSDGQGGIAPTSLATSNTFSNDSIYIPNYTSGNNKSVLVDSVMENNASESWLWLFAGLYGTAAVTSITFAPNAGTAFTSGSEFYLYGVGGARATGGTITVDSNYTYHTFTSAGSFIPSEKIKNAEVLIVAGGGGGGNNYGAGGGAGGVAYAISQTLNAGNSYTVLVGSGGAAGGSNSSGTSGANSTFASIPAIGGGGGAGGAGSTGGTVAGTSGGSGGGGQGRDTGTGGVGGSATQSSGINYIGYGNAGGNGYGGSGGAAGGGGGAGAAGAAGTAALGGVGGIGLSTWSSWHAITGTGVLSGGFYYIAGGGGANANGTNAAGGIGGGGAAGNPATAGTVNTGGGGGGTGTTGGAGGSGLVIVRYPNN